MQGRGVAALGLSGHGPYRGHGQPLAQPAPRRCHLRGRVGEALSPVACGQEAGVWAVPGEAEAASTGGWGQWHTVVMQGGLRRPGQPCPLRTPQYSLLSWAPQRWR